jgi:hypothetical protein
MCAAAPGWSPTTTEPSPAASASDPVQVYAVDMGA